MTVAPVLVAEENATRTAEVQRTLETIYADTDTGQVVAISDGFGVSVAVKDNRLSVGDGIGQHRRTRRWERADRKLKRLIVTGAGSVSLDALSWCADVGVCVVTLDRHARVTGVMVQGTDDARLRRSQALATADSVRAAELLRPLLKAKQAPSNGGTHWSSRSMAKASGLSQSTVSRMRRVFGLKSHLVETWNLSTDPQFVEKARDVVGVYLDRPEKAIVLCVDEKSQIQALDRTAPHRTAPRRCCR